MKLVMKFGGSSVGSAAALRQVIRIVAAARARNDEIVVVVSAMQGITDLLLDTARAVVGGEVERAAAAPRLLKARHHALIRKVFPAGQRAMEAEIAPHFEEFAILIGKLMAGDGLTPELCDRIAALGERVMAQIVAGMLRGQGISATAVMADGFLVTDHRFGAATPLFDLTHTRARARLEPLLAGDIVPVITGFLAATQDGAVTTLGRGGSDYTSTIVGAALRVDEVWIWTDVDGVLTADPTIVANARSLPYLDYLKASELARFGARVLHPQTIQPLTAEGIPVRVLNTFNPHHPGTLIGHDPHHDGAARAVTALRNVALITIESRTPEMEPLGPRLFQTLALLDGRVLMVAQGPTGRRIDILVEEHASPALLDLLEATFKEEIMTNQCRGSSIVAVVGSRQQETQSTLTHLLDILEGARIPLLTIGYTHSQESISFVVPAGHTDDAVRAVHDALGLSHIG